MFKRSPYRGLAQIFFPTLFALLLQGFQIDVDHWRQVFLCFGAVWGLEAARRRWDVHNIYVRNLKSIFNSAEPARVSLVDEAKTNNL